MQCSSSLLTNRAGSFKRSRSETREVTHYPSHLPFPVVLDNNFPEAPYCSRNKDIKSAIHWGQRKLIVSEIQFLSQYCREDVSYHIVYVGSAPGTHIAFLDEMFLCRHTWELIDPGMFDRDTLQGRDNIELRNEFFTNDVAYRINSRRIKEHYPGLASLYQAVTTSSAHHRKELLAALEEHVGSADVARATEEIPSMYEPLLDLPRGLALLCSVAMEKSKPLLFVSDIRTGNLAMPNFEDHVAENMKAQESWTRILDAECSLLKFRLPYTRVAMRYGGRDTVEQKKLISSDGQVVYLQGEVLLPIWTRPTSTEGRLVVRRGAPQVPYDVKKVEDQFFFFNSVVRETIHFNHYFEFHGAFNHHFDASAEIHCLRLYLRFIRPESKQWSEEKLHQEIEVLSQRITAHLGIDFDDAIARRDYLMLKQAREGRSARQSVEDPSLERQRSSWYNKTKKLLQRAAEEREREVWHVNVNETRFHEPSGVWITTTFPQ